MYEGVGGCMWVVVYSSICACHPTPNSSTTLYIRRCRCMYMFRVGLCGAFCFMIGGDVPWGLKGFL